jgi:hypothetical protein
MSATNTGTFIIKGYRKKELIAMYETTRDTFNAWLQNVPDIGNYKGKSYTPAQVQKIIDHLGPPRKELF